MSENTIPFTQALESAQALLCNTLLYSNEGSVRGVVIKAHGERYLELGGFDGVHLYFTIKEVANAYYVDYLRCWMIGGQGSVHRIELISFNKINNLSVSC